MLASRSGVRGSRRNIIKQKIKLAYSISVTLADGSNRSLSKSYGYLIIDIADDRCMKFLIMFANIYSIIFKRNHQLIKKNFIEIVLSFNITCRTELDNYAMLSTTIIVSFVNFRVDVGIKSRIRYRYSFASSLIFDYIRRNG
jgi:hypothetical protein